MSQEPRDLCGVIAFPKESGERQIRFIDSTYHPLFTVPNGGTVYVTDFEGNRRALHCSYIDEYHALIGGRTYHICEFAEEQERAGALYRPKYLQKGQHCDSYEIYQIPDAASDECFLNYENIKGHFSPGNYHRAYAGMLGKNVTLEELFAKHNRDSRPFGRRMRSMSVSDVVVLHRGGGQKAYFVDSCGFQDVSQKFFQKQRSRGEAR